MLTPSKRFALDRSSFSLFMCDIYGRGQQHYAAIGLDTSAVERWLSLQLVHSLTIRINLRVWNQYLYTLFSVINKSKREVFVNPREVIINPKEFFAVPSAVLYEPEDLFRNHRLLDKSQSTLVKPRLPWWIPKYLD